MYGQKHLWVPLVVTIAAAIVLNWFVFGNLTKKKKRSSQTPIVNNNPAASTSASASAAILVGEYEVFLSFRGADTRNGFTDHLYNNLVGAGVCTFRDDNELRVGEEIGPELLRAIKQSKISIPIFSKNYASSKWCLREFAQMVECRKIGEQIIYPIFYDVEPSEVQHYERGSYKAAFLQYSKDKKLDKETVQQWKTALEIVGDLKGLELKKITNGYVPPHEATFNLY
ncbi:hypothetical protein LguiB_010432 [Lonicera macranthoides]